ncbi:facilitated trehalose transporter Tret1-like [Episyrphus balteatus]|uniref:facilitated trehalose transporter Tret1-like n=1 Tax=Episyrphus balteatus TaxID=286459 RepID=UPI0024856C57|nr:facilitated trehalose transporter Tret1-like [Episyrphus balteatus]
MDPVKEYRVFLVSVIANLAYFSLGTCIGWTSPIIPKLRDHTADSPLSKSIGQVEEGWISSFIAIGALIGCPIAGPLSARIGRKWSLLSSALFFTAAFAFLLIANNIWFIYAARILQGVGVGLVCTTMPTYIGEIATSKTRGPAGSLLTVFMVLGILYVYSIGPFVAYMTLQWCCLAIPILFFVTFSCMPETPYFYAMKGLKREGIKSLQFLRGQNAKTVEEEMDQIQIGVDADMCNTGTVKDIFTNRGYRKAFIIVCGLLTFQQLSGTSAVTFNSQSIFTSAKSTLDPAIATIIIGLVQLVANLVTPFIVERAGRKLILMISALGMCLALSALGTFFYIQAFGDASAILWIPIPALIFFNALYSVGFGPVPWVVMGEILPSNIKSSVSSISTTVNWLVTFVVTRWYPELNALGSYYAFWLFGGLCILAFFFILFVVTETKGLSLQKIQEKLQGH